MAPGRRTDPSGVTSGLIGLEYWFFYPYNYYPTVIDSGLMDQAPIAGDRANVDLHQGDWEHVDVLLDPDDDAAASGCTSPATTSRAPSSRGTAR